MEHESKYIKVQIYQEYEKEPVLTVTETEGTKE